MTKYICKGDCGCVADLPGICESEGCSCYGQQLVECDCDTVDKCKACCEEGACKLPEKK